MARLTPATTVEQRMTIHTLALAGHPDGQIAAMLGLALSTVRKWRRRSAQDASLPALTSRMGRPPHGPLATQPADLRAQLLALRRAHPGWGPRTLRLELQRLPAWADQPLPSRARIAALLRSEGLVRPRQRHTALPAAPSVPPQAPHDTWQLDAQGAVSVDGLGTVAVINVADVVSRLKVESYPALRSQPTTADYYLVLRRAFLSYGLPQQITFDHGSCFFDNTTPSPFPTRLHLWLVALGIQVAFTRVHRPTDHGLIERTHQTMQQQALDGQTWADQAALWAGLDARRQVLNEALPVAALGEQAPLVAYPTANSSGRPYRPEWEAGMLDLDRVRTFLAAGHWFRRVTCHGELALGAYRYNVGTAHAHAEVLVTFERSTDTLVCQPSGAASARRVAIKGLSVAALLGEAQGLLGLPAYQLRLPFTPEAVRMADLAQLHQ